MSKTPITAYKNREYAVTRERDVGLVIAWLGLTLIYYALRTDLALVTHVILVAIGVCYLLATAYGTLDMLKMQDSLEHRAHRYARWVIYTLNALPFVVIALALPDAGTAV